MDLTRFHAVFVEEAGEHLENLETGLLRLERAPDDAELLNEIFRSAHTIKGSSGTVGLPDISRFTHVMEELLDDLRNRDLTLTREMISALLEAVDLIKEMIAAVGEHTAFDAARCEPLMERIRGLQGHPAEAAAESAEEAPASPAEPGRLFQITFTPSPDLFRQGGDPARLLAELAELGCIESIHARTDALPPLSDLDPETLYLSWVLTLRTTADESAIRDVFIFVADDSGLVITPLLTPQQELPLLGKILTEEGVVSSDDIRQALSRQQKLGEILVAQGKTTPDEISNALEKQGVQKAETFRKTVSSSIRVDLNKLDHLVNLVGEMVIVHSMFQQVMTDRQRGDGADERDSASEQTDRLFSQLQRIGKEIQEGTMALRMLPVGEVFQRFSRLIRELSTSKGKEIELVISGEETELDKGVLEKVTDPLVHLIRNAVDHGIEPTEERLAAGKPARSTVFLRAYQLGDAVYIEVEDDGRGLDREKILAKALANGVITSEAGLSDEEVCNLIFLPGFSTADRITDISGRGVGMDVVKRNIEELKGTVQLRTRTGQGTTIAIRLPLTLAIIDGLAARIGAEVYIIPITSVIESLRPTRTVLHTVEEQGEVLNVRGEYIPLLRLNRTLAIPDARQHPWEATVVVTQYMNRKYGRLVEELLGEKQVVLKNLGSATPKVQEISGGTIMGDGRVALVLDVAGIVQRANGA